MKTVNQLLEAVREVAPSLKGSEELKLVSIMLDQYRDGRREVQNVIPDYINAAIAEGVENECKNSN